MTKENKRIVLCSDGTANTAMRGRGTNVWKIYEAVDVNGHKDDPENKERQIAYYDDGVGTEQIKLLKLIGGAFGWGLKRNVKQLYTALCRSYELRDEIFLFGFSRGAFTVRTLAGLIDKCGIISTKRDGRPMTDRELKHLVNEAYSCFRKHFKRLWSPLLHQLLPSRKAEKATSSFRRQHAIEHPKHAPDGRVRIKFIGVWDTVDAVGLPVDELATILNSFYPFKFPDFKLNDRVKKACHALAIDDERRTFHPVMWDETEEESNRIEQVWFPGVHSNVGGGYPKQGMSLVSLDWMMAKAEEQGLRFLEDSRKIYHEQQNVDDKLYNSRSGLAMYYRYKPRDIGRICEDNGISVPNIHVSALHRISLGTEGYAPGNLPRSVALVPSDLKREIPGEQPEILKKLVDGISEGGRSESTEKNPNPPLLLDEVKRQVRVRQLTHWIFVLFTLVVLVVPATGIPIASDFVPNLPTWVATALGTAASFVPVFGDRLSEFIIAYPYGIALLVLLLLLYPVALLARRSANAVFSEFWRKRLPRPWYPEPSPSPAPSST